MNEFLEGQVVQRHERMKKSKERNNLNMRKKETKCKRKWVKRLKYTSESYKENQDLERIKERTNFVFTIHSFCHTIHLSLDLRLFETIHFYSIRSQMQFRFAVPQVVLLTLIYGLCFLTTDTSSSHLRRLPRFFLENTRRKESSLNRRRCNYLREELLCRQES
jgi:hypothetical protein